MLPRSVMPRSPLDLPPREASGEFTDLIEIAFQVSKLVLARGLGDAFVARKSRCANGHDTFFLRPAIGHRIGAPDLEQARVSLAAVYVPGQRLHHADQAGR